MAEYKGNPQEENEMGKLSWPEAPKRVTSELPGPKSKELFDKEAAHRIPVRAMPAALAWVLSEAFGSTIKDADGNIFIDLAASVGVNNVGHCHPKVVEIIKKECSVLGHSPDSPTPYTQKLGEKLTQIVPGNLKKNVSIAYGLSGSSAIDMAIKFAKMASKKPILLAFQGAYHGALGGSLAASTSTSRLSNFRTLIPFVTHVGPYAYCYRCPFHLKYPSCDLQCAKYVEFQLSTPYTGTDIRDVAALIVEPIQAEGGYVVPPDGFLSYIKKMCERLGIWYIDDEVQVGLGRTGRMFAIEHYGVEPDFMVLAKALGGDLPMSAVIARKDIVKELPPNSHVLTAAANHISAAVACTNLDLLQDGLVERAAALGDYAMARLREIAKEREIIGDVRGKGLGIGVELVKNRETKKPIEPKQMMEILVKLRDRGVFDLPCGRYGNVIRVIPPLTITKSHLDKGLEILSEVFKEAEKEILE